jgi:hypothetical protein
MYSDQRHSNTLHTPMHVVPFPAKSAYASLSLSLSLSLTHTYTHTHKHTHIRPRKRAHLLHQICNTFFVHAQLAALGQSMTNGELDLLVQCFIPAAAGTAKVVVGESEHILRKHTESCTGDSTCWSSAWTWSGKVQQVVVWTLVLPSQKVQKVPKG